MSYRVEIQDLPEWERGHYTVQVTVRYRSLGTIFGNYKSVLYVGKEYNENSALDEARKVIRRHKEALRLLRSRRIYRGVVVR